MNEACQQSNYDEDVNNVYRDTNQMTGARTSGYPKQAQQTTGNSRRPAEQVRTVASLAGVPKVSKVPEKPKMSLLNNRNKMDHVRLLMCGVEKTAKPAETESAVRPKVAASSAYRQTYVFEEEAKEMVTQCDQTYNFKRTFESHYANEFVKMKGNLRLL